MTDTMSMPSAIIREKSQKLKDLEVVFAQANTPVDLLDDKTRKAFLAEIRHLEKEEQMEILVKFAEALNYQTEKGIQKIREDQQKLLEDKSKDPQDFSLLKLLLDFISRLEASPVTIKNEVISGVECTNISSGVKATPRAQQIINDAYVEAAKDQTDIYVFYPNQPKEHLSERGRQLHEEYQKLSSDADKNKIFAAINRIMGGEAAALTVDGTIIVANTKAKAQSVMMDALGSLAAKTKDSPDCSHRDSFHLHEAAAVAKHLNRAMLQETLDQKLQVIPEASPSRLHM